MGVRRGARRCRAQRVERPDATALVRGRTRLRLHAHDTERLFDEVDSSASSAASAARRCSSSSPPTRRQACTRPRLGSSIFPAVQNLLLAANALGYGSALTTLTTYGGRRAARLARPARAPHADGDRPARTAGTAARSAAAPAGRGDRRIEIDTGRPGDDAKPAPVDGDDARGRDPDQQRPHRRWCRRRSTTRRPRGGTPGRGR